jgi:hypothetical protein
MFYYIDMHLLAHYIKQYIFSELLLNFFVYASRVLASLIDTRVERTYAG